MSGGVSASPGPLPSPRRRSSRPRAGSTGAAAAAAAAGGDEEEEEEDDDDAAGALAAEGGSSLGAGKVALLRKWLEDNFLSPVRFCFSLLLL